MKLSIIMPCFNSEDTLSDAFNSISAQNLNIDYEIIIVDDGSSDKTKDMILEFAKKQNRLKYVFHSINQGGGAARNTAVAHSSGEYIFCLDSDDILPKNMLPKMMAFLEQHNLDGVVIGKSVFFVQDPTDVQFTVTYEEKSLSFTDLFTDKPISVTGNFLYTRLSFEKIGGYPVLHGFDTQGFGYRFLANNLKVAVMKDAFYYQRLPKKDSYYIREVSAGNISKNWFYIFLDSFYKFEKHIQEMIINYPFQDPNWNTSEINLPNYIKKQEKIINPDMLKRNYKEAEEILLASTNKYEQLWLAGRFFNLSKYHEQTKHSCLSLELGMTPWPVMQLALGPLYKSGHFKHDEKLFHKLDFFSKRKLNHREKILVLWVRVKRKIKRELGLK